MNFWQILGISFLILLATGVYGLVHSLLASRQAKKLVESWWGSEGARWYRMGYNIFAFIALLPLLALAIILPDGLIYMLPSPWNGLLTLVQLMGAGLAFVAARQTGLGYLAGLSQLMDRNIRQPQNKLETDGLYRFVRHPIYTGALIFLWAAPQLTWNGFALRLGFTLYFIIGGMAEEKRLVEEFGDEYRAYRLRTPMLIPGMKKHL